jgi:hypothetical protein
MLLQAWERRHRLGDEAYVVDGATGSGRGNWQRVRASTVVENDGKEALGRTLRQRGGSGEVNDGAGSREIFGGKFWQPGDMSESLRGLGFAKAAQRFIYRGTTVATGISDVIGTVATKNHSNDMPLPLSDCC